MSIVKICTLIENNIFPGSSEQWGIQNNNFLFLRTGDGNLTLSDPKVELPKNRYVLINSVRKLDIRNNSSFPIHVRAVKLHCRSLNQVRSRVTVLNINDKKIEMILERLFQKSGAVSEHILNEFTQFVKQMLDDLILQPKIRYLNNIENSYIDKRLILVNRYIRTNYSKPINLNMLSELIGCHPTYLSNTYSKVFGISPIYYINKLRLEQACHLLRNTKQEIGEIAINLGYSTLAQFSAIFKRYHFSTPTAYRRNHSIEKEVKHL
nr:AraC family transcriptional regulator [Paenibacillus xylanexedens]